MNVEDSRVVQIASSSDSYCHNIPCGSKLEDKSKQFCIRCCSLLASLDQPDDLQLITSATLLKLYLSQLLSDCGTPNCPGCCKTRKGQPLYVERASCFRGMTCSTLSLEPVRLTWPFWPLKWLRKHERANGLSFA